jgi:hypothetical protein
MATIKTHSSSKILVLSKRDFNRIIKDKGDKMTNEELNYYKKIPILKSIHPNSVRDIWSKSVRVKYNKGAVIFAEKEEANLFYIIK